MGKIKTNLKNTYTKSKETLKSAFDYTSDRIMDGLRAIGNLGADSQEKFRMYMKQLMDDLPLLEKAGYKTVQFEAGISIPPSVEIHFRKFKDISDEEMAQIKEEFKNRKVFLLLLNALIKANNFQNSISTENFISDIITIDITIPPEVKVKFKRKDLVMLPDHYKYPKEFTGGNANPGQEEIL